MEEKFRFEVFTLAIKVFFLHKCDKDFISYASHHMWPFVSLFGDAEKTSFSIKNAEKEYVDSSRS